MKITDVTTRLIGVDATAWYSEAGRPEGALGAWKYPLTCVSTDEGIDGYATGYDTHGGGRMIADLIHDQYRDLLVAQDPLHSEAIWHRLKRANRHLRNARDAALGMLDVALWDIKGKVADFPIGTLLGLCRTRVPTYATCSPLQLPTPERSFEEAQRAKELGYRGFKLQVWDGPARDIPRLRAAREAVGPDFPLMFDAAGAYGFTEALEVGHVLEELDYRWFEEPIPDRQIWLLRRLAQELTVPVLAAETTTVDELPEYLRQDAIDMARGDVYIKGGITGLRKALAMCELFGFDLEIHTAATPLLDVANLHVACAVDNCKYLEHHLGHRLVSDFGLKGPLVPIDGDGYQYLPEGPGLGVEIDWDWVEDHTVGII